MYVCDNKTTKSFFSDGSIALGDVFCRNGILSEVFSYGVVSRVSGVVAVAYTTVHGRITGL